MVRRTLARLTRWGLQGGYALSRAASALLPEPWVRSCTAGFAGTLQATVPAAPARYLTRSLALLSRLPPDAPERLSLTEFHNRMRAWTLFQTGRKQVRRQDIVELVERLCEEGGRDTPWLLEGVGYAFARGREADWLRNPRFPLRTRLPLHTGSSLWYAHRLCADLAGKGVIETEERLEAYWEERARQTLPEYLETMFEGIGLMVVNFHPGLFPTIARALKRLPPPLPGLFYHGWGRGAYFRPDHFLPFTHETARARQACEDLPDVTARRNAVAGLYWARTLVNLYHPEIIAAHLAEAPAHLHRDIGEGIAAALVTWRDSAPDDPAVDELRQFSAPDPALWRRVVTEPASRAFQETSSRSVGDGFHVAPAQPLPVLEAYYG
ncbi:MAG: hypothetical protein QNK37_38435 [Acidobacteriota bacterium]|nr:hypothetical protein [Acidobacteriota bacterium]